MEEIFPLVVATVLLILGTLWIMKAFFAGKAIGCALLPFKGCLVLLLVGVIVLFLLALICST